jgi:hypothetical protein
VARKAGGAMIFQWRLPPPRITRLRCMTRGSIQRGRPGEAQGGDATERHAGELNRAIGNIESTCARLAANGVKFVKELAEFPWGKFASFGDT